VLSDKVEWSTKKRKSDRYQFGDFEDSILRWQCGAQYMWTKRTPSVEQGGKLARKILPRTKRKARITAEANWKRPIFVNQNCPAAQLEAELTQRLEFNVLKYLDATIEIPRQF